MSTLQDFSTVTLDDEDDCECHPNDEMRCWPCVRTGATVFKGESA